MSKVTLVWVALGVAFLFLVIGGMGVENRKLEEKNTELTKEVSIWKENHRAASVQVAQSRNMEGCPAFRTVNRDSFTIAIQCANTSKGPWSTVFIIRR